MFLLPLALAAPPPPGESHLSGTLREVLARIEADGSPGREDSLLHPLDPDGLSVVIEPLPGEDAGEMAQRLSVGGYRVEALGGGRVQVFVPFGQLKTLSGEAGVSRVREPWRATAKGETTSEGYGAVMASDWHDAGVTGSGVLIGVIDVGFLDIETLEGVDTPEDRILDLTRGTNVDNHGTAVTEIIYDFAPDASYQLATFSTDVEFCEIVNDMVTIGVDVINASIGFDNVWHADGTSSLSQCADFAVDSGIQYFAAAGNENFRYRVGALSYDGTDGTIAIDGEWQLWAGTLFGETDISFRWSEPMDGAAEDIDLVVYNEDGSECGRSEDTQDGNGYPVEMVYATGCSELVYGVIYSSAQQATLDGLEGYFYAVSGVLSELRTDTEDLTLPGDVRDGITVGAYELDDGVIATYSSRGPTNDGRLKPDVVAPTGISTETFGRLHFDGTSSATPHATGLGALYLSARKGKADPEELKAWMMDGAVDLGEVGVDNVYGAGAIQGDAVPSGCGCSSGGAPGWWVLGGLGILARRRRC